MNGEVNKTERELKLATDAAMEMANAIIGTSILKRMSVATQEWVRLNVANKQPARQSKGPGF